LIHQRRLFAVGGRTPLFGEFPGALEDLLEFGVSEGGAEKAPHLFAVPADEVFKLLAAVFAEAAEALFQLFADGAVDGLVGFDEFGLDVGRLVEVQALDGATGRGGAGGRGGDFVGSPGRVGGELRGRGGELRDEQATGDTEEEG
jgi:hypothetical protein